MGVMIFLSDIMIPLLIFGIVGYGILNRQNIYEEFIDGAKDGFQTVIAARTGDRLAGFSAGADTGHGGQNVLVLCGDRSSFGYI